MKQFEYEQLAPTRSQLIDTFNDWGEDGWRVIHLEGPEGDYPHFWVVVEREKPRRKKRAKKKATR